MKAHTRILLLVGVPAIIASLLIAVAFVLANGEGARLEADEAAAHELQALGDQLLAGVLQQREALDAYLLSGAAEPLARYRQAVADETQTREQIQAGVSSLTEVAAALIAVDVANGVWQDTVAAPAIAAVQSGSDERVKAAIQMEIQDDEDAQAAATRFVLTINTVESELGIRSDALSGLRVAATAFGVGIELLAAALSLWFVRRYGMTVARDARRRVQTSDERVAIIASLRKLRMQQTPEETATLIAEALSRLPGIDVAGVFENTPNGLLALAIVSMPGFPFQSGDLIPEAHARYLREHSAHGPWAEHWIRPAEPNAYETHLAAVGIKSRAFAPIETNGELIGLIGLATTDEVHAHHLVEDLPAVGEFASVAETILAPALIARRDRAEKRRQIGAVIGSGAFSPVFQPVIDLATGATVGFEALTRFADGCRPDVRFAAAVMCGMGIELETVTLEAALREARNLAPGAWLGMNVSPALLTEGGLLGRLLADRSRQFVLEITEHEAIAAYAPLREAMLELGPGVRLAVDDAGAGVANFYHLVELRPSFVKIDAGLVHGVDTDPGRRAVVVGLIHFAAEAGCQVIAEGIETDAERATLAELGVTLGQGFLLGRPAPADTWSSTLVPAGSRLRILKPARAAS